MHLVKIKIIGQMKDMPDSRDIIERSIHLIFSYKKSAFTSAWENGDLLGGSPTVG